MQTIFTTSQKNNRAVTRLSHQWDNTTHTEEISSWEEFMNAVSTFMNNRRHWNNAPKLTSECLQWNLPIEAEKTMFPSGKIELRFPFNPHYPKLYNFKFKDNYPEPITNGIFILEAQPTGFISYKISVGDEVEYV